MATSYPGGLDSFSDPVGTDLLGNPVPALVHHSQHDNINDAMVAVQAKVGITNSTDPTSLDAKTTANVYLTGSGVPGAGLGANGNLYLNTATGIVYAKSAGTWAAVYTPSGGGGVAAGSGELLANGWGNMYRASASAVNTSTSGILRVFGTIAPKSFTAAKMAMYVASGPSGGTLLKYALYSLDAAGNGTLIASTASFHTLATTGKIQQSFVTPVAVTAGTLYAMAVVFVGTTSPQWAVSPNFAISNMSINEQPISGALVGQTDAPATYTAASLAGNSATWYMNLTT